MIKGKKERSSNKGLNRIIVIEGILRRKKKERGIGGSLEENDKVINKEEKIEVIKEKKNKV